MAKATHEVYIKLPGGKAVSSQHHPSKTIGQLAEFIANGEGIPAARVSIKYLGKTLDKSRDIGYLGICPETILKGEIVFPKDLTVYVKYPSGTCEPLLVQTTDTVSDLKGKIHEAAGIPTHKQLLRKEPNGIVIYGSDAILADFGITNACVIKVHRNNTPNQTETTIEEEMADKLFSSFDTKGRRVEVIFCFDTTGDSYSYLTELRQRLRQTCERLFRDIPSIRIAIMANGDYCDYKNVVTFTNMTSDVDTIVNFVNNVSSRGGEDSKVLFLCPVCDTTSGKCYELALRKAQQLDWSEDSAKALVMIGNKLPHKPSYTDQNLFWMAETDVLAGMGVKIYGVQPLNTMCWSNKFFWEMADRTFGYYISLENPSLITDLFLAVCYREASPFVEEIKGRMTEGAKAMLQNFKNNPLSWEEQHTGLCYREIMAAWWNPRLDSSTAHPEYLYDHAKDVWIRNSRFTPPVHPPPIAAIIYKPPASGKSKLRKMLGLA